MGIKEALAKYSETYRDPFNDALFIRSEYDIIEDVKKIIMSVASPTNVNTEKKSLFIGVNYFRTIDDYRAVRNIVYDLESDENRRNKRIDYNIYDFINLKDSDIILLEVNYHLEVNGVPMDASVYIDIPKVIDKYFFRISGTIYSTLYQIADASTYNNSQSKKKVRNVSFRQEFQKHVVYEKKMKINQIIYDENGNKTDGVNVAQCIVYTTDLFGNNIPLIKYFLAKFGFLGTMNFLRLDYIFMTIDEPYHPSDEFVVFQKDNVYMSVPYIIWDSSPVTQSFIWTVLYNCPKKCTDIDKLYSKEYWLTMLGADFKNKSVEKGLAMLESVSRNYSIIMKEGLKLPDDQKETLLEVLRWEMYEFEALWNKDNYDMTFKKLRISSYIAGFYAAKLTRNLVLATNSLNSLTTEKLYKTLRIPHDFILDSLKRSNLVSYKNGVNDDDIFSALKYTFKGISGIGENKASAVPVKYRLANASHIGKVDCDTSPAGDPGMTGLVCPYAELEPGMYLGKYEEPNNWAAMQDSIIDEYRRLSSRASIFKTKEEIMGTSEGREFIETILAKAGNLLPYTVGNDPEIR